MIRGHPRQPSIKHGIVCPCYLQIVVGLGTVFKINQFISLAVLQSCRVFCRSQKNSHDFFSAGHFLTKKVDTLRFVDKSFCS